MTHDYARVLNNLESGSWGRADMPAVMALLDYETKPHARLGMACRAHGDRHWQSLPRFDSADDFEMWVLNKGLGKLCDIGVEDDGRHYVSFEHVKHGNDYGYSRRLGLAMWAAFVAVAGQVERPE